MSKFVVAIAALGSIGAAATYATAGADAESRPTAAGVASPTVLELYQSQGCSSCPPANAVLNEIAGRPDVIALNFGVTYWDQLGWKDIFADPKYTARQWEYARAGGRGNVQTPQLIVDGRTAILGSRKNEVLTQIAQHRTPAGAPAIATQSGAVTVGAGQAARAATVWLVDYDPRTINVPVRAGENGGRTLPHRNVVKRLTALGNWKGPAARFALPAGPANTLRAVLVQSGTGGPILAARKI